MSQTADSRPWIFNFVKWYGYMFAVTFLLYGCVSIILGFLDRQTDDMSEWIIFVLVGAIVISVCVAFRDRRPWGWYGLVGVNALIVVFALFDLGQSLNILLMAMSLIALVALFIPQTKGMIFKGR
ncbi:MAG: hypothetical protein DRP45_08915 [Candidatus Zixiibacteriota bacterium]|nr:MAG: hypothetical protein DRP45_08915 [candidate division Zixibacteria bacterium]